MSIITKQNKQTVAMKISKVADTPTKENPHNVDVRLLYNKDTAQALHMLLAPGESLKPHKTPVDVFFFVIEGTPDILLGEEKVRVKANSLIDSPKDIIHCIYNNTDSIVRILVVKAPKPLTSTKIL